MLMPSQAGTVAVVAGVGAGVTAGAAVGAVVGSGFGLEVGGGVEAGSASTPVAAYSTARPKRELTETPSIEVIEYQVEPDFEVGQTVLHDPPETVPDTTTALVGVSLTAIVEVVEVEVRMFTLEHAGASVCEVALAGTTTRRPISNPATIADSPRPRARPGGAYGRREVRSIDFKGCQRRR
jgi:hypothetical protein